MEHGDRESQAGGAILSSIAASSLWMDSLIALFWDVKEFLEKNGEKSLPEEIVNAYKTAETARQRLEARNG